MIYLNMQLFIQNITHLFIEKRNEHINEALEILDYIVKKGFLTTVKHNAFDIPAEERDKSIKDSLKALVNKESGILPILIL